jgi:putative flippase GtrA
MGEQVHERGRGSGVSSGASRLTPLARYTALLHAGAARPLRFALTGGLAGLVQLTLLALLTRHGWPSLTANLVAFLLAAQVNFAVSMTFTWRDRRHGQRIWRRWLLFHGAIAGMAALNMLIFALARMAMPDLAASALGILAGAVGNFLAGDRLVFRVLGSGEPDVLAEEPAA